jgi:hypothetical protein
MSLEAKLALARAAVEVCFEQEDSGGLVVPFMRHLGVSEDDTCKREWADSVGPAVRSAIERWAGSVPDFQWKFVGPVRVHTGVPRLLIPRFARLIYDLACDHGLDTVVSLQSTTVQRAVAAAFQGTRFASEFLSSDAGEELVRAASAVLGRSGWPVQRDIAAVVAMEPGFHAGFLRQLVHDLNDLLDGEDRKPMRGVPRSLWPVLMVVEDKGQLAVKFPGLSRTRKCRYTWSQCGAYSRVVRSVMYLGRGVRHEGVFSGTVEQGDLEGNWAISAWPRKSSNWAVFDLSGAILGSQGEAAVLPAGEYLLAVNAEVHAASRQAIGFEVRADLGLLDFDGAGVGEFTLLHVALAAGCMALPDACIGPISTSPRLEADATHPLASVTPEIDAVLLMDEPHLRVTGWTAERSSHFRVVMESDGVFADVTSQLRPWAGAHRLSLPNRPHVGLVRVEGRGRRSGSLKSESAMSYAVWPKVSLLRSAAILGANETGTVKIDTSAALDVVDSRGNSMSRTVDIAPPMDEVSFVLRIDREELLVSARISRARMSVPGHIGTPLILDFAAVLASDRGPSTGRVGDFTISAGPRKGWSLSLRTGSGTHTLFEVSDFAAEKVAIGRYPLRWSQISDAVRAAEGAVGVLELCQYGQRLSLDAVLVDSAALFKPDAARVVPDGTPEELATTLQGLRALQSGSPPPDAGVSTSIDSLQEVLDSWMRGARIVHGIENRLEGKSRSLAALIRRSHERLRPSEAMVLLEEWKQLRAEEVLVACGIPKTLWPDRWRSLLVDAKNRLESGSDLTGLLRQLRKAVVERSLPPPEVPDGLLMGLRNYRAAFSTGASDVRRVAGTAALQQLNAASAATVEPWGEVAKAFYLLTMLRSGNVSQFLADAARITVTGAIPASLTYIAQSLRAGMVPLVSTECTWCIREVSPLDDDAVLVALSQRDSTRAFGAWTWLTLWLHWRERTAATNGDGSDVLRLARAKVDEIPGTLQDRDKIVSELEFGKLSTWQ